MSISQAEKKDQQVAITGEAGPTLWNRYTLLSVVSTVAVFIFLASYVNVGRVRLEVAACNKLLLVLAAFSHYATYPLRGARWRRSLKQLSVQCGNARFGLLVFFYTFVDNVVPAKLGELYAAHLARINCGVRRSAALGSIVFLRMVDAWVVLLPAAVTSWFLFSAALPRPVVWALVAACIVALTTTAVIAVFLFLKRSMPAWVPESVRQRIGAFQTGMLPNPREIMRVVLLTVAVWVLETIWIFLLARAFNVHITAGEAVFLTMIPVVATAFPLTPSGAGAVELTLFASLRLIGIASPLAVSLTVVNRFLDYWLHIFLGTFIWMIRRRIGLRTWKENPAYGAGDAQALAALVEKEIAP